MRGEDRTNEALSSYVDIEPRTAANHPLAAMRRMTNAPLAELNGRFDALWRSFVPPEWLLRPHCCSFSIRSAWSGGWWTD
jgi:hypothetical protein